VETVAEGLYRVSPLLRGVGLDVQGEAWVTAMHGGIARAVLGFHTLSPTDVSTILFHATAGRDWSAATHLSFGILKSDNETWEALADSAAWFVLVGTGNAATRPETDPFSLFLIRLLQFRLAAAAKNDKAADSVIACMDEELPATVEGMPLRLARHFFLGQVLLRTEVNLSIAQLMAMGLEYIRVGDELADARRSGRTRIRSRHDRSGRHARSCLRRRLHAGGAPDRQAFPRGAPRCVRASRNDRGPPPPVVCWRPGIHRSARLRPRLARRVQECFA
jgi:hypothetical protein